MGLQNDRGQILIEAVVASILMGVILLALTQLIELKKSQKDQYQILKKRAEHLNEKYKSGYKAK